MKKIILLIALLFSVTMTKSQNTEKQKIKLLPQKATIYLKGAEISSKKSINLAKGKSQIEFTGLPFYLNRKSIRVTSPDGVTIYAVNHQRNFLSKENKEIPELVKKKETLEKKIQDNRLQQQTLDKQLKFLEENMKVNGSQTNLNVNNLKAVDDYFTKQVKEIIYKKDEINTKIRKLNDEIQLINKQINELNNDPKSTSSSIIVEVETEKAGNYPFSLSYVIKNAGWFPSYDIRFQSTNQPMQLAYYANIYQNSNINWKDIQLTLSSSNPDLSNTLANLKTYYLNYGLKPPSYTDEMISKVTGRVFDTNDRSPIPGVSVNIEGSTIGAITDIDGNYEINVPSGQGTLVFSTVGMDTKKVPINKEHINVWLTPNTDALEEVVVVGFGKKEKNGYVGSTSKRKYNAPMELRGKAAGINIKQNIEFDTKKEKYQTNVEFNIKKPYSIPSDNKTHKLKIETLSIPAKYTYLSIPKIKQSTYLKAHIEDWENLNLLSGAANIYYEGTYTGETVLDLNSFNDTLTIAMGVDKGIIVKRELLKQNSSTSFWGNKKTDKRSWKIIVRNNKPYTVQLKLKDQIPVSANESIKVEEYKTDGGKYNDKTGEITWNIKLKPEEKVEKIISYEVKYFRNKNLIIE